MAELKQVTSADLAELGYKRTVTRKPHGMLSVADNAEAANVNAKKLESELLEASASHEVLQRVLFGETRGTVSGTKLLKPPSGAQ